MELVFILVNPAVYENIGLSLRAIKTMGMKELRIVGKFDPERAEVRKTAYGSHDLLQRVSTYESLSDALHDIDLAVGTTSKKRTSRKDVVVASDLKNYIKKMGEAVRKPAIVFGSEENGLSKEEINHCQVVSTIPLAVKYPSLNLGQSVMIYAYELSGLELENIDKKASESLFSTMLSEGEEIIRWLELDKNPALFRRIKDRLSRAGETDIHMILSAFKKIRRKMDDSGD